jgi:molecular chaperone DnaJ
MDPRNYYAILGVPRDESAAGIRSAYRDFAKEHPAGVGDEEATRAFQEIAEAYRVLSDPPRRRRYDERIHGLEPATRGASASSPPAWEREEPLREPASLLCDAEAVHPSFDALYDRFLRNFTGRGVPKSERLEALNFDLVLTPGEAARGGTLPVAVPVFVTCPECAGTGQDWLFPCTRCGRQGVLESERLVGIRILPMTVPGTVVEVPLEGLGIHNFFLRLHVFVEG